MAHILDEPALFTWCEHGIPSGHYCHWCPPPAQRGWECPCCHRVWNPSVLACHHCPVPEIDGCP